LTIKCDDTTTQEKPKAKKEEDESSDESDYSSDSRQDSTPPSRATPMRLAGGGGCARGKLNSVSKMINNVDNRSTSASLDDNDDYYDDEYDTSGGQGEAKEKAIIKDLIEAKKKRYQEQAEVVTPGGGGTARNSRAASRSEASKDPSDIDDIWKNNTSEYKPASPRYVLSQFGKNVAKAMIDRIVDCDDPSLVPPSGSQKVSNKFAVAPVKLPKTNITRLEVAFERSARQNRSAAVAPKSSSGKGISKVAVVKREMANDHGDSTSSEDTSSSGVGEEEEESDSESENSGSGDGLHRILGSNSARLAGGAEKRPCLSSGSVSDTETLVGDESRSRLAGCKREISLIGTLVGAILA